MDNLEKAKKKVADLFKQIPKGAELKITSCEEDVWLGIGYYLGRGWVVYRGSDNYRLTETGRQRINEYFSERT